MNSNGTFTCETCDKDIDCRIGYSNRRVQPLSFACPECNSIIEITLTLEDENPKFTFKGVTTDPSKKYGMFDGRNPFVDLHLDFPIWSHEYVMGFTPFLAAIQRMDGTKNYGSFPTPHSHFQARLDQLNDLHEKARDLKRTIRLYYGENKKLFIKRAEEYTEEKLERTLAPEDINLALYRLISKTFLPFIEPESTADFALDISQLVLDIASKNNEAFENLMNEVISTSYLSNIQRDCLEIYPRILEAEIALRPAIFLDYVEDDASSKISGKISTKDFNCYKDLYKDITEILGKQLILVAAINNIIHRGDHNKFQTKDGGSLSSLQKFADKTLSDKFKYLDNCWFNFDKTAINPGARNAIAHYSTEYDERTQKIQLFAEKEGLKQEKAQDMYFLEFMRILLAAFREMHYLHHVVKSLFYYEYIARAKNKK